ncbi:MAG: N-acetylneuraminate synthase [Candidatus Riflebacteria bacterium]|nr:N-acetylneuraminate synthase [Candidatus Riflebacteria bacterium]
MKKVYIIAEAGVNHNGNLEMAFKLIDSALKAGVDAVKFQTFKASEIVTKLVPKAEYQKKQTNADETQFEMLKKLELDQSAHQKLFQYCKQNKIEFVSTPFDEKSLFLLKELSVSKIKVSSCDLTNLPFLYKVALLNLPVILSTGMATLPEIVLALGVLAFGFLNMQEQPSLEAFKNAYESKPGKIILKNQVTLLHCTSEYPTPYREVNLLAMETLRKEFDLNTGYSDHTQGIAVSVAAVAMGASVIEKHFTLDKNLPGPDHKASLEPDELKEMVSEIRHVEEALGSYEKKPSFSEINNLLVVRKSIVASKNISAGELFTHENISIKRPGNGLSPKNFWKILGCPAPRDFFVDELIEL